MRRQLVATQQRLDLLADDAMALVNQLKQQGYSPAGAIALLSTALAAICIRQQMPEVLELSLNEITSNVLNTPQAWKDTIQ